MIYNGDNANFYRRSTEQMRPINLAQKTCVGPCKRRRSVGQFAPGDAVCQQCRRRG